VRAADFSGASSTLYNSLLGLIREVTETSKLGVVMSDLWLQSGHSRVSCRFRAFAPIDSVCSENLCISLSGGIFALSSIFCGAYDDNIW
jgi:hypothetical protein